MTKHREFRCKNGLVIVKKHIKPFKRFQSDRFKRVKEAWRRPRGIDNRVRRRFKGAIAMPNIGYGSDKRTKYMMKNGLKPFLVSKVEDLEMLLMHNKTLSAIVRHEVGARKRKEIVARARQLNIHVVNGDARLHVEE